MEHLVDGDGGDEKLEGLSDEENPELTIRSVVNNLLLYQEGWGVGAQTLAHLQRRVEPRLSPHLTRPPGITASRVSVPSHVRIVIEVAEASRSRRSPTCPWKNFIRSRAKLFRAASRPSPGLECRLCQAPLYTARFLPTAFTRFCRQESETDALLAMYN